MRVLASILAIIMLAAAHSAAGETKAPTSTLADEVFKAEQDFDAYTAEHRVTVGFHAYSTPNAIGFRPEAVNIHERMGDLIAKGEGGKDAPSKLRWRPYRIAVAASGDMAWDIGPWTFEGTDRAGWFFTIWRKQPDGRWLWSLDTGAGAAPADTLPNPGASETFTASATTRVDPNAIAAATARNAELDITLASTPAVDAYKTFIIPKVTFIAGGEAPVSDPHGVGERLSLRPRGLAWDADGYGQSAAGDMIYSYGHTTDSAGVHQGHYVRIWTRISKKPGDWKLSVDIYNSAK